MHLLSKNLSFFMLKKTETRCLQNVIPAPSSSPKTPLSPFCCLIPFPSHFLTNIKTRFVAIQKFFPQSALPVHSYLIATYQLSLQPLRQLTQPPLCLRASLIIVRHDFLCKVVPSTVLLRPSILYYSKQISSSFCSSDTPPLLYQFVERHLSILMTTPPSQ